MTFQDHWTTVSPLSLLFSLHYQKKKKNPFVLWHLNFKYNYKLLGPKDLETNVFRTQMCNVGKPWSKQVLVLFRLLKVCALYVKLESSGCRSISDFRPGSIDQRTGSIDRISGRMCFSAEFQLSPSSLKRLGFYVFAPGI